MRKTSTFENSLIWFGAAVSIAEIITGTYFAPLGFKIGLLAILIGHIIGAVLLYLSGLIGAKSKKTAMETVKMSFGQKGGLFFASLNVLQLVGWTAIMIYDGAISASHIFKTDHIIWALVIGILIIVWLKIGITNLGKVNKLSMTLLFILTIVVSVKLFSQINFGIQTSSNGLRFGQAIELAIAMPLSWLPLISDYTKEAEKEKSASLASAIVYSLVSSWMYIIGMTMAIVTRQSDIAKIMLELGLGLVAVLIIVLSTVTTTFLDSYSAGVSSESISKKINGKIFAIIVTIVATVGAVIFNMDDITDFLYLIGSVFAPMIAIQIADYYILKINKSKKDYYFKNFVVWLVGFVTYKMFLQINIFIGPSLFSIIIIVILKIMVEKIIKD